MVSVTLASKVTGYNPPDYYRVLRISNVDVFLQEFTTNRVADVLTAAHSIENNLGKLIVPYNSNINTATVVHIYDDSDYYHYIGVINNIRRISKTEVEITYSVDWYTSQVVSSLKLGLQMPTAKTMMYKRKSDGEFNYIDDGFKPVKITPTRYPLYLTKSGTDYELFETTSGAYPILMVYHESTTNTDHWIVCNATNPTYRLPENIWNNYCTAQVVSGHAFDAANIVYYGAINVSFECLPVYSIGSQTYYYRLNSVFVYNNDFTASVESCNTYSGIIKSSSNLTCKDYEYVKILDIDGTTIYELPVGVTLDTMNVTVDVCYNMSSPSIVFKIVDDKYKNQLSFSISFKSCNIFADAEAIYHAEERVYAQEMRNLTSTNELVSGIISAVNQGAMINAFSRTQTESPVGNVDKGMVGGGLALGGSVANYAYQQLYANKESQRIEDNRAKVRADTLIMAGGVISALADIAGIYVFSYDSTTKTNITAYQSAFGYATNQISNSVALNTMSGYIQADILLDGGLRTEIEQYIKDMFNYGVRFG